MLAIWAGRIYIISVINYNVDALRHPYYFYRYNMSDKLTQEIIDSLHEGLKAKRIDLDSQIQAINMQLRSISDTAADLADSAQVIEDRNNLMAHLKQMQKALNDVDVAIKSYDDYGLCKSCFDDIAPQRLMANPMATLCIHCKTVEEHNNRVNLGRRQ